MPRRENLDEWGISWERYRELVMFCLQYNQKKRDAAALLTLKLSTPPPAIYHRNGREYGTFLPHGYGGVSDPVAITAAKRDKLLRDVRMIEQAAMAAVEDEGERVLYPYLLKAVITRAGVHGLYADPDKKPPKGERQFKKLRRKFFWILSEMKDGFIEPIS